jgi:CheY-like chemotaxis protein
MHLVELHGGSIRFESILGEGSRFTITLPWNDRNQNERAEVVSTKATLRTMPLVLDNTGPSKGSLVLIDDNTTILETLSDFLMVAGYTVFSFSNGPEALAGLSSNAADVVITDIQMPGMDGLEVTRLLRGSRNKALSAVPIIALTALAMPGDEEKCLAAGANIYLAKPVSLAGLLMELDKLIQG